MRTIVLLLALMLAVAGCTDKSAIDEPAGPGDGSGHGNNSTETDSPPAGNASNNPPTATLQANVTTASAPFIVVFTLNGTDADNDTLSWTLDADGDGVADQEGDGIPANATFEYAAGGTYNVTVNVTDGIDTIQLNMTLVLEAAGLPALPPFVGSGVADAPCPQCREAGANTGAGYRAGISGVDSVFLSIPAEYIGYPFTAEASGGDIDLSFRSSCAGGSAAGDPFVASGAEAGIVPAGAGCVLMWNYNAPDTTLTITIG